MPLPEIKEYLLASGAIERTLNVYDHEGLEVKISVYTDSTLPDLGILRHTIEVNGDKPLAEKFLTAFRFRFLSAGG